MTTLMSKYDELVEKYKQEGRFEVVHPNEVEAFQNKLKEKLKDLRIKNQIRSAEAAEALSKIILTA